MTEEKFNPADSAFFPDTISRLTVQELKKLRTEQEEGKLFKSGLDNIDKVLTPFRKGELVPILGYMNNYKSAFMSYLCNYAATQINPDDNEIIVTCSWEDSVEDRGIWDLAEMTQLDTTALARGEFSDLEWKKLIDASLERADKPIYYIGHSDQDLRRRPRLSLPQVWQVLEHLYSYHGKQARMVALDYLQRIRPDKERNNWRVAMMEIVDTAKDMAIAFGAPVLLGTQAGRKSQDLAVPRLPQVEHAQETSNIEQSAGKFFSLCLPHKTMTIGEPFDFAGGSFKVTENLLLIGLLKQKKGPAPKYFAFHVDWTTHELTPYKAQDLRHV